MAEQSTNLNSLINLGLGSDVPDNIKDQEVRSVYATFLQTCTNIIQYVEQYCGVTQKDTSQWPTLTPSDTIKSANLNRVYCKANVNLSYGHMVNLFLSGGVLQARLANQGTGIMCHGYCNVTGGTLAGNYTEIIIQIGLVSISGVVIGQTYWLANAGLISNVAGGTPQVVGFGIATDLLMVGIDFGALN